MAAGAEKPFSSQENNVIDQLLKMAMAITTSNNTKKMTTASPLAQGKKYVAKGQNSTTASYTTNVRIGHIELIKFIHEELSSKNSKSFIEKTVTNYNSHHSIQYYAKSVPRPSIRP